MNNDKCRMGRAQFTNPINHLPSLYQLTVLAIFIVPAAVNLVYAEAPELKMHVFDTSAPKAAVPNNDQGLNMIIFDEETNSEKTIEKGVVTTQTANAETQVKEDFKYWSAGLKTGYKNDSFKWQVASPDNSISPFVATKWDNVNLWQIQADVGFQLPVGFVAKAHAAYAFTFAGNAQQNGYFDNNSDPAVQTNSSADSGYAADFSGAVGYQFDWNDQSSNSLSGYVTPLVGFAFQEQKYSMRGGTQTVTGESPTQANLNNDYIAGWIGPWLGFDAGVNLFKQHRVFTSFEHHWADFRGLGNWQNSHLEHLAKAHGYKTQIGYQYQPNAIWAFNLAFEYQFWDTNTGTERLTLTNQTVLESQLNSAVRESFGVNAGVNVAF